MPRPPAYKTAQSPLPRILDALRGGADLTTAARVGGVGAGRATGGRQPDHDELAEQAEGWCP